MENEVEVGIYFLINSNHYLKQFHDVVGIVAIDFVLSLKICRMEVGGPSYYPISPFFCIFCKIICRDCKKEIDRSGTCPLCAWLITIF
jgi:hypothetical protein